MRRFHCLLAGLVCMSMSVSLCAQAHHKSAPAVLSEIPFVGCPSDGQLGPQPAPEGKPLHLPIPTELAAQIAYYEMNEDFGVLAPRGWHCFGIVGSYGIQLVVAPQPLSWELLWGEHAEPLRGPAVHLAGIDGDTSGRFEVGRAVLRLFPIYHAYVRRIIHEHIDESLATARRKPFPADKLTYRGTHRVYYVTPPHQKGEGTQSRLAADDESIEGVIEVGGQDMDMTYLAARLPKTQRALVSYIEHYVLHPPDKPVIDAPQKP